METNQTFYYNKELVITNDKLMRLYAILSEQCPQVRIKVRLKNQTDVKFDSFEELKQYHNEKDKRIIEMELNGDGDKARIMIRILDDRTISRSRIAVCDMSFKDDNNRRVFESKYKEWLNDSTEGVHQHTLWRLVILVLVLLTAFILFGIYLSKTQNMRGDAMIPFAVGALVVWLAVTKLLDYCFYPAVIFAWGKGQERYNKITERRKQWLWTLIVSPLVSGLVGYLITRMHQ